jgi:hypothetical protein
MVIGVFFQGLVLSLGLQVLVLSHKTKTLAFLLCGGCLLQALLCYLGSFYSSEGVVLASVLAKLVTAMLVFKVAMKVLDPLHWVPIVKNALALLPMLAGLLLFHKTSLFSNHMVQCVIIAAPIYGVSIAILNYRTIRQLTEKLRSKKNA